MAIRQSTVQQFRGDDLTGRIFDRLRVVEFSHRTGLGKAYWLCLCSCGTRRPIPGDRLRSGETVSCGCWGQEALRAATHRRTLPEEERARRRRTRKCPGKRDRDRVIWRGMISRCHNPRCDSYPDYGERGITVCDRWRKSFANFLADMGRRPSARHTIDRINNDRGYEPGNCRWATRAEQARNKRSNRLLTFGGRTQCIEDWSRELAVSAGTLTKRLRLGWPIERILTTGGRRGEARWKPFPWVA